MFRPGAALMALVVTLSCGGAATVEAQQAARRTPAVRANPVAATAESLAAGRQVYQRLCRACHHASGNGKGPYGIAKSLTPSDFTDARWDFGASDGEIFAAIRDGIPSPQLEEATRRPTAGGPSLDHAYEGRISDRDIWNVVNHLRTFAQKPAGP